MEIERFSILFKSYIRKTTKIQVKSVIFIFVCVYRLNEKFRRQYYTDTTPVNVKATAGGVLCKKLSLKVSQNSQENTSVRVCFIIKLQILDLRTPFLQNTHERVLL